MEIEVSIRKRKPTPYKTSRHSEQYTINISGVGIFDRIFKNKLPDGIYRIYVLDGSYSIYNITHTHHNKYLGEMPEYLKDEILKFLADNNIDKHKLIDDGIW